MNPTPNSNQPPHPVPNVAALVWGALVLSQFLFVFILRSQFQSLPFEASQMLPDFNDPLQLILTVMALVVFIMAWVLPKILLKIIRAKVAASGSSAIESLSLDQVVKLTFVPNIVRWALFESIGLYGFVIANSNPSPYRIIPFVTLAVLSQLKTYPSENYLRELLEE